MIYAMTLTGEVSAGGWGMQVGRQALLAAIGKPGERVGPVVLVVCERGLSVRAPRSRADLAGTGFWASPIEVEAGRLRQALARETERSVRLEVVGGRLSVNARSIPAREI